MARKPADTRYFPKAHRNVCANSAQMAENYAKPICCPAVNHHKDASMPRARTTFSRVLRNTATATAMLAAASASALASEHVTLGIVPWIGYGPIYVAAAKGFFAQHGLDVKLVNFNDTAAMPGAVYAGQVSATTLTYDQVIGANAKGWHLKVVMPIDYSAGADAMLATDDITSVQQLKGQKVAFAALSPSDFLLGYALQQVGLSKKDITQVDTTAESVPGIMVGGSTKLGVTYEPNVSAIVQADGGKKFHVLYSSRDAKGLITDVLVVSPKTIQKDPVMITGMIQAFVAGEAYMQSHPADANAIIGKALGIAAADVPGQLAGVQNPQLAEMPSVLAKSDKLPSFYVSNPVIGNLLKSEDQITEIPPVEDTYDASFVDTLAAQAK
jgi:NitT/TauT family transport system substrate-binding protein